MTGEGKAVCVTGASGYIASWLVKHLLHRGYTVHATVRSLGQLLLLSNFDFPSTVLHFKSTGYQRNYDTISYVVNAITIRSLLNFHLAQLLQPAVNGTLNVLKSAAKVSSLKRVVLTYSIAAVFYDNSKSDSSVVDETWFSDPETCEQKELWYALSKTLAEKAAVKFCEENGLDLVVINPGFVLGPLLQPTLNLTSEEFIALIETGKEVFPGGIYGIVDVRDVAIAHILAFENLEASGRYLMVSAICHSSEIMKIVQKHYPDFANHAEWYKDMKYVGPPRISVSKSKAERASGYIASWIVKLLLQRGYNVHATVRSLDDPKKTEHLRALDGAKERLSLFEANLTEEGSFDSAINGCECVFHTASPVLLSVSDPQAQLLEPAVKGTLNILKSASKASSVTRVVMTSSMFAVYYGVKPPDFGVVMDETWFSDPETCEQKELWYALSKTLAEDAGVKFCKENDMDLVVINPGYVIGPILQPTLNYTSEAFINLIETGKEVFPDGIYRLVDVRDVAIAHILAFENPKANGRYCLVSAVSHSSEIMKIVHKHYPNLEHAERYKDIKYIGPPPFSVSKTKAENLGVNFTPLEISIKDTIESLKENNFMSF
ncbi:hypothetical protein LXL04_010892 [Taraxacum kok-saghyz]